MTDFEDVYLGSRVAMPSEQPLSFDRAVHLILLLIWSVVVRSGSSLENGLMTLRWRFVSQLV